MYHVSLGVDSIPYMYVGYTIYSIDSMYVHGYSHIEMTITQKIIGFIGGSFRA